MISVWNHKSRIENSYISIPVLICLWRCSEAESLPGLFQARPETLDLGEKLVRVGQAHGLPPTGPATGMEGPTLQLLTARCWLATEKGQFLMLRWLFHFIQSLLPVRSPWCGQGYRVSFFLHTWNKRSSQHSHPSGKNHYSITSSSSF